MQPEQTNPVPQPAYAAPQPVPQNHSQSSGGNSDYISNPFLNSVRGLVLMLQVNPVAIMLSGLVGLLAIFVFLIGQGFLSAILGGSAGIVVSLIGSVAALIGIVLIGGSYNVIAGRSAREQHITTMESYAIAGKRFFGSLLLGIILAVLYLLLTILFILPGIYFLARASLALFVFYEENLSAVAALKRSFELTKGHAVEMLGAVVASIFLGGGSGLLSGAISLSPLVGRYHDLKQLKETGAPKPKVHYLNWLMTVLALIFVVAYVGFIAYASYSANRSIREIQTHNQFNTNSSNFLPENSPNSGNGSFNTGTGNNTYRN